MRLRVCLLVCSLFGCSDETCTEIPCEHTSEVGFPIGLVDGPYDLTITADVGTIMARCLEPSAPEAEANPPELHCDREGFTLEGGEFAQMRELGVTVVDVDTEELLAAANVDASVVDELTPNGPDCPGVCYVRNGALMVDEPPD